MGEWTNGPLHASIEEVYNARGQSLGEASTTWVSAMEARANAKLWAAAPDLFGALEKTLTALINLARQLRTDERLADLNLDEAEAAEADATAALAKARGEAR